MVVPALRRDPEWLSERRLAARARAESLPPPRPTDETWRFTDLRLLDLEQFTHPFALAPPVAPVAAGTELPAGELEGEIVLLDGVARSVRLSDRALAAGVKLMDLTEAVLSHPELVRERLGTLAEASDVFLASNLALHQGGAFLHVPAGVELRGPIRVRSTSSAGLVCYPRHLVIVEEGARLTLQDLAGSGDLERPALAVPVTELYLAPGAHLRWLIWQSWGARARQLAHLHAALGREAVLESLVVTLGAELARNWLEVRLAGEGATSNLLGIYAPRGVERVEHWTVQEHAAPHTTSDLHYRGALADQAGAVYYGTIRVQPSARRTDAYQANRNLLLSSGATATSNPRLEIAQNDVRCTHGATVGPIDEEQLFYLSSRGIPRREAELLLVGGFFQTVLDRAPWSGVGELLQQTIRRRVARQGAGR